MKKKKSFHSAPALKFHEQQREKRDEARRQLADVTDPGILKNSIKRPIQLAAENSFGAIAREWHAKFTSKWS